MFSKQLFGQRLQEIRKLNHETQTDLGEIIDVNKSRISEMEHGKQTTTAEKIALICEHYQVSSDYLLGLSDDPSPRERSVTFPSVDPPPAGLALKAPQSGASRRGRAELPMTAQRGHGTTGVDFPCLTGKIFSSAAPPACINLHSRIILVDFTHREC